MKKICLIGQFDSVVKSLYQEMVNYFQTQFCSNEPEQIGDMLSMANQDLILVYMTDMTEKHNPIFAEIEKNYAELPIICVANTVEKKRFEEMLTALQAELLERPINNQDVLYKVCEILDVPVKEREESVVEAQSISKSNNQRKKILVVDDSAVQLRMMKNLLHDQYEVSLVKSGKEAISYLNRKVPDLIFLDYDMPDGDGKETFEQIKQMENAKDIPVVFLTSIRDKERIEDVLALKPAGYVLKPTEQTRIFETLEELL